MATSSAFDTSNQYIKYRIVVTENSTSIQDNTSSVNVKVQAWRTNTGYTTYGSGTCYCNIDGTDYSQSISPSQEITHNSYTVLFDKDVTITHNADGNKNIFVSAYISHARFNSNSQGFNVTLSTIPRQAKLTSAPDFSDIDNPTIVYSNPAGNTVTSLQACISLTGARDDIAYRDISKTGTSYTFELTQAERGILLAACPDSNTLNVKFYVRTILAGQTYYSSLDRKMTVKNGNPVITGSSYYDTNATTISITQNNQQIIQGQSTVTFKFSELAAVKAATLSRIEITVNAVTVSSALAGSGMVNKTVAFGVINSSSNLSASIKLIDSRGNSTTQSLNITILSWSLPTAIISLSRKSNYYDETYLKVNADYSSLDNKNTITIQYQYKEVSSSFWSALASLQDDVQVTLSLSNLSAFDFKIIVTDRIGSTTYNKVLQIGIPILYIDRLKRSVGVGTIPDQTNQLAVDRRVELKNTLQEEVANLWSTITTGNFRSAFLQFKNQLGKLVLQLGGNTSNGGGYLGIYNSNGDSRASISLSSYDRGNIYLSDENNNQRVKIYGDGGVVLSDSSNDTSIDLSGSDGKITARELSLKNSSGDLVGWFKSDSGGGQFVACDTSGNGVAWLYNNNGGRLWLADSSGNAVITAYASNGNITCVSLTQTSSRKVKENIKPMNIDEARKILRLQAVSFDFKDKSQGIDKRGFIAEDVAEVIPELVTPETETEPAKLDYIEMIPYLLETIKNQERRIQELETMVEELSKRLG
jgi:hypothetical protein